jgi:hypothetical protein
VGVSQCDLPSTVVSHDFVTSTKGECIPELAQTALTSWLYLEALKKDGRVLLTPTFFAGKPAIRAAFVNWSTSEQDIPLILDALEQCARE